MATKTGKTPASYYKNDLAIDQNTNTGIDSTTRAVHDGAGQSTAISLSDNVLSVQPVSSDTTGSMLVKNNAGNNILAVDTTNSKVLMGASQVAANTQYALFGVSHATSSTYADDTHYAIPFGPFDISLATVSMGSATSSSFNDTEPATSLTFTATAMDMVNYYWYIMDDITIDRVVWWQGADTASGPESTAAYLMGYTVDTTTNYSGGDLSSGVKLASSSTVANQGYEQAYYNQMTIHNADVDAGKVVLFTFAQGSESSDYTLKCTVKFHIR